MSASRGWVPPEARPWRHPSEIPPAGAFAGGDRGKGAAGVAGSPGGASGNGTPGGASGGASGGVPALSGGGLLHRHRRAASVLVGSGAAGAIMVGILLLMNTGFTPVEGTASTPLATQAVATVSQSTGCCQGVPAIARPVQEAMVSLQVAKRSGLSAGCGVAVAPGGLIVTTYDAVEGARSVLAVTAGGAQEPAQVVAADRGSDIAIIRVASDLPTASFVDNSAPPTGSRVMAMAMTTPAGDSGQVVTVWSNGTIRSIGAAVSSGNATGMAGIGATVPAMPMMPGELLLTSGGEIMGILDSTGSLANQPRTAVFLPAQLVLGVARDLASSGKIRHGWLDVTGRDTTRRGTRGVLVVHVNGNGASARSLRPGDVIVRIDGAPVRSMAELHSRLYTMGPGSRVHLSILRDGRAASVTVDLGSSP